MNMSILSTDEYVHHSGTSYTRCYQFEGCEMPSILGSTCINPSGDVVGLWNPASEQKEHKDLFDLFKKVVYSLLERFLSGKIVESRFGPKSE